MAVVAVPPPQPQHWGIFLPAKEAGPDAFLSEIAQKKLGEDKELSDEGKDFYKKYLSGGQHSYTDRTINIYLEGTDEAFALGAKTSTKVQEIKELLFGVSGRDPKMITVKKKAASGTVVLKDGDECPSKVIVGGIGTLKRAIREYDNPIFVVGCGLGGIQVTIEMLEHGRKDIIMMDKHADFGGHSWISVPNKFTKLQTERGTYHVTFTQPWAPALRHVEGKPYKTWPARDQLLAMMREGCRDHGLYEYAQFNMEIQKIQAKKGVYTIQHCACNRAGLEDADSEDLEGDADCTIAASVSAWPGFLHDLNEVEFPGEDEFDGYIEYSSFDRTDYRKVVKKPGVLYGHGAFTIENVRTLVEHMASKIWVVCRRRNLSGTKIASWLVGYMEQPLPATLLLEAFKKMYDLVGFDVWTAHSVTTDRKRTYAQLTQATIFGVTDVYFLAGYYKLMECVVDEVKRLSYHTVHTKNGQKFNAEWFIKAIGTKPSFKIEKQLGINHCVGSWVNGDPMYYVCMSVKGVQAKNFGSFSVGPGFAPMIKIATWFLNYPEDWALVKDLLPVNRSGAHGWPAYVSDAAFGTPMFMILSSNIPGLGQATGEQGAIKARKQKESHPLEEYLADCCKEWAAYTKFFRENGMIDKDAPDCPYPYSKPEIENWINLAERIYWGEKMEFAPDAPELEDEPAQEASPE